jgi:hypothetical protein
MAIKRHGAQKVLPETREQWPLMSLYERFEQVVAIVLSLVIAAVIALVLVQPLLRMVRFTGCCVNGIIALRWRRQSARPCVSQLHAL